jgi:hypothetical protein
LREKLKAKLKELIRKQMKEISTSGAAGGSPADGSAGPVKTPYAFGKVKDPTTGLDGYKQVGKNETGTINEKEAKKPEKSEKNLLNTNQLLSQRKVHQLIQTNLQN